MARCNVAHPEHPEVTCVHEAGSNHDLHGGFIKVGSNRDPIEWENPEYVAPARKRMGKIREAVKGARDPGPRDLPEGERQKDAGTGEASEHADEQWKASFDRRLRELAATGVPFTSEDVTETVGLPPGHPSAVGARMNAASRRGEITQVGYIKAERPNQHAATLTQWQGVGVESASLVLQNFD